MERFDVHMIHLNKVLNTITENKIVRDLKPYEKIVNENKPFAVECMEVVNKHVTLLEGTMESLAQFESISRNMTTSLVGAEEKLGKEILCKVIKLYFHSIHFLSIACTLLANGKLNCLCILHG